MELKENEVTLTMEEFLKLHDFKEKIDNNKVECVIQRRSYFNNMYSVPHSMSEAFNVDTPVYKAKEEIIEEIKKVIDSNDKILDLNYKNVCEQLQKANSRIYELEQLKDLPKKELTVQDIKNMSWKDIKKWKRENKNG